MRKTLARRPPQAFDAFISYSHAARGMAVTEALHHRLERFGRRWPRARALRLFRDKTSLSASPGLWTAIEQALSASRWFILMASPKAAGSEWVRREIDFWIADPDRRTRLLIVLVEGTLEWDERRNQFDETSTAAPANLLTAFPEEPLYVDLTGEGGPGQAYSQAGMEAAVASLAARIQGRSLDEMVGAHLREQRRNRRLAWTAMSTLALLTVASLVAALVAVGQTREARRQADRALARQLAAQSTASLDRRLDVAQLLAVRAYRTEPDEQARSALLRAVTAQPALTRFVSVGATITSIAGSADGRVIVAGTANGQVVRWTTDRPRPERIMSLPGSVDRVALDRTGTRVIAAGDASTQLWTAGSGSLRIGSGGRAVGLSPSGRYAVFSSSGRVRALDLTSNRPFTAPDVIDASDLVVPDDGQVLLAEYAYGRWQRLRLPNLAKVDDDTVGFGVHNSAAAMSPDGSLLTYTNGADVVSLWRTRNPTRGVDDSDLEAGSHGPRPDALAVSPDNRFLATAANGTVYLAPVVARGRPVTAPVALEGNTVTQLVTFLGDARHLVSASGDAVSVWDVDQVSRIATRLTVGVPDSCNSCSEPWTALNGDGSIAAFTSMYGDKVMVDSWTARRQLLRLDGDSPLDYQYGPPVFLPDGRTLVVPTATGAEAYGPFGDERNAPRRLWGRSDTKASFVMAAAVLPGQRLLVARLPNLLETRDAGTGQLLGRTTIDFHPPDTGTAQRSAMAEVDPSGRYAAFAGENEVLIVDPRTGGKVATIAGPALRVHFGGDVLAVEFDDGRIETRRPADGSLVHTIPGDLGTRNAFAISSDGGRLARFGDDGPVQLFDLRSGRPEPFGVLGEGLNGIQYHGVVKFTGGDSRLLLAMEGDGSDELPGEIQQWRLSPEDWIMVACETAGRALSTAEWTTYVGTDRPPANSCSA